MNGWEIGNALEVGEERRGWLIGHFIPPDELRHSEDVEVKWHRHPTGDIRSEWVTGETRTTILVLISGAFRIAFRDGEKVLTELGDYAMWGPGIDHIWEALEESIMLTVRWPSIAQ